MTHTVKEGVILDRLTGNLILRVVATNHTFLGRAQSLKNFKKDFKLSVYFVNFMQRFLNYKF